MKNEFKLSSHIANQLRPSVKGGSCLAMVNCVIGQPNVEITKMVNEIDFFTLDLFTL